MAEQARLQPVDPHRVEDPYQGHEEHGRDRGNQNVDQVGRDAEVEAAEANRGGGGGGV